MDSKKLFAVVFEIIGIGMFMAGLIAGIISYRFKSTATRTEGVVVSLLAGGSHPNISFHTKEGHEICFSENGWIAGYKVGDRVYVIYKSNDPQYTATLDVFGSVHAGFTFLTVVGALFFAMGFLSYNDKLFVQALQSKIKE